MTFTAKQRDELARARATVAKLEADEAAAVGVASDALHVAGLRLVDPGVDFGAFDGWAAVCREHAKAIRDALEPFDDGERIEVVTPQPLGDVLREANQ